MPTAFGQHRIYILGVLFPCCIQIIVRVTSHEHWGDSFHWSLTVQKYIQANKKGIIKPLHYRPFFRGIQPSKVVPFTWWFPSQRASDAESVSMSWYHAYAYVCLYSWQKVASNIHYFHLKNEYTWVTGFWMTCDLMIKIQCFLAAVCICISFYIYSWSSLPEISSICMNEYYIRLQLRHNERDGVSNHQPHDYLLKRLFRRRSKKTSKLRVTGLCGRNSPVTGEFPAQRASNAENISIWWCHHENQNAVIFHWPLWIASHSPHKRHGIIDSQKNLENDMSIWGLV